MTRSIERTPAAIDNETTGIQYTLDPEATGYVAPIDNPSLDTESPSIEVNALQSFHHLFSSDFLSSASVLQEGKYVLGIDYKRRLAETAEGAETLITLLDKDDPWRDYALAQLSDHWTTQQQPEHAFRVASTIQDHTVQLYALSKLEQHNNNQQLEKKLLRKINDDTTKVLDDYNVKIDDSGSVKNIANIDNASLKALDLATRITGNKKLHRAVEAEEEKFDSNNEHVQEAAFQLEIARLAQASIINTPKNTKKAA